MKIVFFTCKCSHGAELLKQISSKHVSIEAIIIEKQKSQLKIKLLYKKVKQILTQHGYLELFRILVNKVATKLQQNSMEKWHLDDYYKNYSERVFIVDDFNGKDSEQILKKIIPDMVILGGTGIIRSNIIKIPKIGILNVHPGLLPKYRGVDVIPWAILNGDDIGVTVHSIDEGIDTGEIIQQKIIEIAEDDTIDSLRKKAEVISGELLVETILKIMESKCIHAMQQSKRDGKQYYKMPNNIFREAEKKLRVRINERKRN